MPKPSDYKHIKAWGKMLGSRSYYIKGEQEKAAKENAPLTAVYYNQSKDIWIVFRDVASTTQEKLKELL